MDADPPLAQVGALVLAAGLGTRLGGAMPKVLQQVGGRPMVALAAGAARAAGAAPVLVVVRPGQEAVRATSGADAFVIQAEPLGTAHAVAQARHALPATLDDLLILYGDTPLLQPATLKSVIAAHRAAGAVLTVVTCRRGDPRGMGRVRRGPDGRLEGVVEEAEADEAERAITEWNTGVYCVRLAWLWPALERVRPSARGEYYLTDLVALAAAADAAASVTLDDPEEAFGVNLPGELARAERALQRRLRERWLARGVRFLDAGSTYLEVAVELAPDVAIEAGVALCGETCVARGTRIGAGSRLVDSIVGEGCRIEGSTLEGARLGAGVLVGPASVIRARLPQP